MTSSSGGSFQLPKIVETYSSCSKRLILTINSDSKVLVFRNMLNNAFVDELHVKSYISVCQPSKGIMPTVVLSNRSPLVSN